MGQFKLSKADIAQLKNNNITETQVYSQISIFQKGAPYVTLNRPCTIGDGIKRFSRERIEQSLQCYLEKAVKRELIKFVPASGAATRMFKTLIQAIPARSNDQQLISGKPKRNKHLTDVMANCHRFAFFEDLKTSLSKHGQDADALIQTGHYNQILIHLLTEQGLNYANLPKGLIKFHSYGGHNRTAFEEHLVEANGYAKTESNDCALHFTISPSHQEKFISVYQNLRSDYTNQFQANFNVTFSTQKNETNTIAVDMENQPYRLGDGSILFRPGGHGALIENLNQLDADIVFIKNVDNVSHDRFKTEMIQWKKILCGHLICLQEQIFNFLSALQKESVLPELIYTIYEFIQKELCIQPPENSKATSLEKHRETLIQLLNRPLRVCGMVPNVKEPGGGPFWIEDDSGNLSIQIIETAQINPDSPQIEVMLKNMTHFNPVDIVCGLRDVQGKPFDLSKFVDHQAVFITHKSENGKDLKALELPGLWNGSMAYWNTVFVEVPGITFNPVKQLTDLLQETHQPG